MEKITYASDAQGVIYAGRRVIARDNPENLQSAEDIAGLVFRANIAPDLLAALEAANCPVWVHNAAITTDIEALRRIALWYSNYWNNKVMPILAKAKKDNNGWPGEPGVPLNPQKPGIHWLLTPDNDPIVKFWAGDAWELREGATTARRIAQDGWRYLGSCLPPETANDLISACEDALAVEIEAGFPDSELADRLRAALAKAKGE